MVSAVCVKCSVCRWQWVSFQDEIFFNVLFNFESSFFSTSGFIYLKSYWAVVAANPADVT